jgi:hypothetical protein
VVRLYVVSITPAHFLLFRPKVQPSFQNNKLTIPKEINIDALKLDFEAELQSLLSITHTREIKNEYTFVFDG